MALEPAIPGHLDSTLSSPWSFCPQALDMQRDGPAAGQVSFRVSGAPAMPRRMPLCRTFLAPMRSGVDSSAARAHLDRRRCHSPVVAHRVVAATSHTKDGATLYRCGSMPCRLSGVRTSIDDDVKSGNMWSHVGWAPSHQRESTAALP